MKESRSKKNKFLGLYCVHIFSLSVILVIKTRRKQVNLRLVAHATESEQNCFIENSSVRECSRVGP